MSFNSAIETLPAPGAMVVDGNTNDWDLSAGVWSYNDPTIVDRYSVWTHLMWDDKGVYFLARYHDLSPLQNAAQGKDFSQSWRADCYQARVIFDDGAKDEHEMHVNMYYSSSDKRPYMIIKHGGFRSAPPYDATGPDRPDQLEKWGPTMEKAGGKMAVAPWADGKGYNLEVFWPWSYCRTSGQPLAPGEAFTFGIEAMWGNTDGTRMTHRLADGIKDETVSRIFMFRARPGWGRAILRDRGKLDIFEQQLALQKARLKRFADYDTYGSVPIRYDLPVARDVTIAIDNAAGKRVRNLFGQYPRPAGKLTDLWDGLDDSGNPVAPGKYTATIVHHEPVELKLFNSVYSSATPPWITEQGFKLWGANHGHPTSVATRGDVTVLLFTGTEGGSGMQRIDDNGIIQWANANEFVDGTLDDTYVYGLSRSSWQNRTLLARLRVSDGQLVPFDDAARTPMATLLPDPNIGNSSCIAMAYGKLWVLCPKRVFQRVNPKTGAVEATLEAGEMAALTDRDDRLYALANDGTISLLDAEGKPTSVVCRVSGVKRPVRLGVSLDGQRLAISDPGQNQVLIVSPAGKLLQAIGLSYEDRDRPAGAFVPTDLIQPLGADFDHLGRLWVSEGVKTCKRVTCWSPDYQLVDQYWGQADYGAMAGFPLTFDATRFIAHGIEFKLDPKPDPLHRKTNEQPLIYHPDLTEERGLIYRVGSNEYACAAPGYNKPKALPLFKRDAGGVFRACVKIKLDDGSGMKGKDKHFTGRGWVDRNDNGQEDAGEVTENLDVRGLYWANGWVRPDLAILIPNNRFFQPKGFSPGGVPLYDFTQPEKVGDGRPFASGQGACGTPVLDMAGNVSDGITYRTVDGRTGSYPNRYGRHDAPAAQRGVLIAPFRANGVVEKVPGVGSIMALGGDRGQWFLLSMDGLYLSSICQDSKGDVTLDETFIGQESFGGFIWRDTASNKVLVQLGGPSYRLMEVTGLDTCAKVVCELNVTDKDIAEGARIVQSRQQQSVREPERMGISRVKALPKEPAPVMQTLSRPLIEGGTDIHVTESGNPARWWRAALVHDGRSLAIMAQVADPSPWRNGEGRFTHLFIGGDSVDLQLDVPGRGPIRLLAAPMAGKPVAVYWQHKADVPANPITYAVGNNVANMETFATVRQLTNATVVASVGFNAYTVLITVPLKELGLDQVLGKSLTGLVGVIFSEPSGNNRAARVYWHNKQTGLVSDVPSESRLQPKLWGPVEVAK